MKSTFPPNCLCMFMHFVMMSIQYLLSKASLTYSNFNELLLKLKYFSYWLAISSDLLGIKFKKTLKFKAEMLVVFSFHKYFEFTELLGFTVMQYLLWRFSQICQQLLQIVAKRGSCLGICCAWFIWTRTEKIQIKGNAMVNNNASLIINEFEPSDSVSKLLPFFILQHLPAIYYLLAINIVRVYSSKFSKNRKLVDCDELFSELHC